MPGLFLLIRNCPNGTVQKEDKMSDSFFKNQEPEPEKVETPVSDKIKLGEEEFTTDELQDLVKLGRIGREAEEKFNTSIDKVWPSYTKTTQELKEKSERLEQLEREALNKKAESGQQLSDDELAQRAREEARRLGLVTREELDNYFESKASAREQAQMLLTDCRGLEKEIDGTDGRPAFKTNEMLEYMQETGIKNPTSAYKQKFESQLDKWKEEKLASNKGSGFPTIESSSAGSEKLPPDKIPKNPEELHKALSDFFTK